MKITVGPGRFVCNGGSASCNGSIITDPAVVQCSSIRAYGSTGYPGIAQRIKSSMFSSQ